MKPAALLLGLILLLGIGEFYAPALEYDRAAIVQGEYWRLLTCHLTHVNNTHLFLNLGGTLLLFFLFGARHTWRQWLLATLLIMVGVGGALLLFNPEVAWYRGLSGLLHGLLLMGIIGELKRGDPIYLLAAGLLFLKVAAEQFSAPFSPHTIDIPVIAASHLYGLVGGVVTASFLARSAKRASGECARSPEQRVHDSTPQ